MPMIIQSQIIISYRIKKTYFFNFSLCSKCAQKRQTLYQKLIGFILEKKTRNIAGKIKHCSVLQSDLEICLESVPIILIFHFENKTSQNMNVMPLKNPRCDESHIFTIE
jgi:hypothetical protein